MAREIFAAADGLERYVMRELEWNRYELCTPGWAMPADVREIACERMPCGCTLEFSAALA